MATIGIIGAMEEEIASLKEKITIEKTEHALNLCFYIGSFAGHQIILVRSGIGKVNAAICTQSMIDRYHIDYVINIGVAGSLSKELHIGDILVSTDLVQHDMDTSAFGDAIGTIPRMDIRYFQADTKLITLAQKAAELCHLDCRVITGRVASGDQFINSQEAKNRILDTVGGDCAEMEGAAIAHTCYLNDIPFVVLRAISDDANEAAQMSFADFTLLAAKNSSLLAETIIEHLSEA